MTKRRQFYLIVIGFLFLLILIYSTNLYFINWLAADQTPSVPDAFLKEKKHFHRQAIAANESNFRSGLQQTAEDFYPKLNRGAAIRAVVETRVTKLKTVFKNKNPRYYPIKRGLLRSFSVKSFNLSTVWKIAGSVCLVFLI